MAACLALHVVHHGFFDALACQGAVYATQVQRVPAGEPPGVVVSLSPHHHAVKHGELLLHGRVGLETAVDGDGEVREVALELRGHGVAQRRDLAVLLGRQTLEPGIACMHDEHAAARLGHGADEVAHETIVLALVDAYAVLDRDGHAHCVHHGLDTVGHKLGLVHEAGAEGPALHALARAATVEVDLVVAPLLAQARAVRQVLRLAAAQLQRHGVFRRIEAQVPRHIAMQQRARGHHLGVEQGVVRQQAVQVAAVAVGPVEHGGDGHAPRVGLCVLWHADSGGGNCTAVTWVRSLVSGV